MSGISPENKSLGNRLLGRIVSIKQSSEVEVEKDDEFLEAIKFANTYKPKEGKDYGWVMDYARTVNEMSLSAKRINDTKAESLIRFLAAGVGTLGVVSVYSATPPFLSVFFLPAFLCALWAIREASLALRPEPHPFPPEVKSALETADRFNDVSQSVASFAAAIDISSKGYIASTKIKGERIRKAHSLSFWAVVWIFFGVELAASLRLLGFV